MSKRKRKDTEQMRLFPDGVASDTADVEIPGVGVGATGEYENPVHRRFPTVTTCRECGGEYVFFRIRKNRWQAGCERGHTWKTEIRTEE